MFIGCWSAVGGSGVSLLASALSLILARKSGNGSLLVDFTGDCEFLLGLALEGEPGFSEWLDHGHDAPIGAVGRLEHPVSDRLTLLPRGSLEPVDSGRIDLLTALLARDSRPVVVDLGRLTAGPGAACRIARTVSHSWLVTRACEIALRRADELPIRPTGTVLVVEPGRLIGRRAVEDRLGVPVVAEVAFDPSIFRAVDRGHLVHRVPRKLVRSLRNAI